jgi:hypothetical protein
MLYFAKVKQNVAISAKGKNTVISKIETEEPNENLGSRVFHGTSSRPDAKRTPITKIVLCA